MKICLLLPLYSIISILSLVYAEVDVYLHPWLNVVESLAVGSFFLLLLEYVSESRAERDVFFAALVIVDKKAQRKGQSSQKGGLPWYRVCSRSIAYVIQRVNTSLETMDHDISISRRFIFNSDFYSHNSSYR